MTGRLTVQQERRIGRYQIYGELASGGMGAVHFGRLVGEQGFTRVVAIKRLHRHLAKLEAFAAMFLEEARLAARIRHPNVVATLDTIAEGGELLLVMEYVAGESLAGLQRACAERGELMPIPIVVRLAGDALYGLHAAHVATGADGLALGIVHRDVSPQNILVGSDGMARVLDFGIAKATSLAEASHESARIGKLRYMAPERLMAEPVTPRTDVYALSVVLWELLTGEKLFDASNEAAIIVKITGSVVVPPSRLAPNVSDALSDVVMRGLARAPEDRFTTADEMAVALEKASPPARAREVSEWMRAVAGATIDERSAYVVAMERAADGDSDPSLGHRAAPSSLRPHGAELATHTATATASPAFRPQDRTVLLATVPLAASPLAPRRRDARWKVVSAALGALVVLGIVVATSLRSRETAAGAAVATAPETSARTDAGEHAGEVVSAPEIASAPPLAAPATPSSSAEAAGSRRSAAPLRPALAPASTSGSRGRPSAKSSCNPPYEVDAKGIRRIKDGCL